ncbi:hypothetical protein KC343_g9230 [Hortaea werneckii]|nr:hypothetical protein KC352_g17322 [Hortaea werneckii]KAI7562471.1 hypothetical protein KC317_g8382 [Hortaea werneckii]KAI7610750.1 hypothetical protein KC346_g8609 [Hortaea werneckii]KAI7618067.1 hypothetical protein KC343_g9230 [Hortaea werneckii]KAI7679590.1 hypothetical protein KC319_g2667 [Hortaea werneckii]
MDALGLTLFDDVIPTNTIVPASILTNSPQCPQPMVQLDEHGDGVSTVGPSCSFWGGHVSVYYWNTWDSPTSSSGLAPAPTNASLPRVTTVGNITMTYPSVYLSLDQLTAWTEAMVWSYSTTSLVTASMYQHQVGDTYRNIVIPMDPADVSSLRHVPIDYSAFMDSITASGVYNLSLISRSQTPDMSYMGYIGTPRPMDYQHITAPSPEDYFLNPNMPPNCDWTSRNDMCGTIYEGDYRPQLSLPSKLIDLDPAWKNCEPHINGIYDPPKALQPATTLDGPLFASLLPTTTSAKQASSVIAPTPTPTSPQPKSTPASAIEDPASDRTSAQGQSTSQVMPTSNTAGPDEPESPSTVKETGEPAPSSSDGQSSQDSETLVASTPSGGGEASAITTDADNSTQDEIFLSSPGTTAKADPSSSLNADPPNTSLANDPSVSTSQNLVENRPEAAPSSADEALSTAPENALSVLSAAQATYTSQDPATAGIHMSASGAVTVPTQTTVQTGATAVDSDKNDPPISETRTVPIEVAGNTFTATQVVNPTGATQVQVADTTLSVGGSPVSIGNGNQVGAASDGIVVVGGGNGEQTSTLPFPTSAQAGADAAAAQGGVAENFSSAGKVSGTGVVVGEGSTLLVGGDALSTAGQGLSSVPGETGVGGQAATSTIPPGAVGTEARRPSQGQIDFVVSAAGATFTASSLENGAIGLGDGKVLTPGGSDLVLGSATLSFGSAGIVVAGVEETSTVQLPTAEETTKVPAGVLVSLDSQTITASPMGSNGMVLDEGTTLSAGGPAVTVGQQSLSLDSAGILVYGPDGTSTVPTSQYPTQTPEASSFLLTVGSQTIPASRINPSALALPDSHTTLTVGGEAAVIADETVSLDHSAIILASGTKTSSLPFDHHQLSTSPVPAAVITALQTQYTIFPDPEHTDALVINDHTLAPGSGPITLPDGETLRLGPSGLEVADATRTTTLSLPAAATALESTSGEAQAVVTVDGSTLTAYAAGQSNTAAGAAIVVAGTTLSPGGDALRLGDGTVSLGPSGLVVAGGDQAMTTVPLTESTSSRNGEVQSTASPSGTVTPSMSSEGGEAEESEGSEPSATASSAAVREGGWVAGWASALLAVVTAAFLIAV